MNGFKLISAVVAGLFGIVLLAMILPLGMGRSPVAFSVIEMLVGLLEMPAMRLPLSSCLK